MKNYIETDVLIIGGGIAGSSAALMLADNNLDVLMIMKGEGLEDTNSDKAQGGIALQGPDEKPEEFVQDIMNSGDMVNNRPAVEHLVGKSREYVNEILINKLNVDFTREGTGKDADYCYAREGAHSRRRILNVKDMTGRIIQQDFKKYLKKKKNLKILANHSAIDILTTPHHSSDPSRVYDEPRAVGAYVFNHMTKEVFRVFAKKVILATGGFSSIFLNSTNVKSAIGNGVAMAFRAGARLGNLEYVQFHPTSLYHKDSERFLISEAVRGEGAKLMNRKGEYFMKKYSPLGDLAPRDEVSRAIYEEMINHGDDYVLLDIASFAKINIKNRFPTIYENCLKYDIDIEKRPVPVVPSAHYSCGGVITDFKGRTSMKNLYAVGEVATTGIHGANRLASVSLLEGLVYGCESALDIVDCMKKGEDPGYTISEIGEWHTPENQEKFDPALIWQDTALIRSTMWNYSGIIRTMKRLERARADLEYLRHRINKFYQQAEIVPQVLDLRDSVQTALLVVYSAIRNKVSKGAHYIELKD